MEMFKDDNMLGTQILPEVRENFMNGPQDNPANKRE